MGIIGIYPFLAKEFPQVVKDIPERFKSFSGRTIALDGTLITQRFWFSSDAHHYRHVRGWYRLISELRAAGVKAICIFDGKCRNQAKHRETQRRETTRKLTDTRASLEADRIKRLTRFYQLFQQFQSLTLDDRTKVASEIAQLARSTKVPARFVPNGSVFDSETDVGTPSHDNMIDGEGEVVDEWMKSLRRRVPTRTHPTSASDLYADVDLSTSLRRLTLSAPMGDSPFDLHSTKDATKCGSRSSTTQTIDAKGLTKRLAVLYRDYHRTARQEQLAPIVSDCVLSKFVDTSVEPPVEPPKNATIEEGEPESDLSMSKIQSQLIAEEGNIWASIFHPQSESTIPPSSLKLPFVPPEPALEDGSSPSPGEVVDEIPDELVDRLHKLTLASDHLFRSYAKRRETPTSRTYDDCRTILSAMGIPIIEAPFPYEAEAVAASLCVEGLADAVGSEDTDVLVYEAPLLRNVTSREVPLTYISGAEVRDALGLTTPAYIDFALLLGSDFSQRLRRLGPKRAIKLVQAEGSIEAILQSEKTKPKGKPFTPEPKLSEHEYLKQIETARAIFRNRPPISEEIKDQVDQRLEVDESIIVEILRGFDLHSEVWKEDQWTNPLEVDYFGTSSSNPLSSSCSMLSQPAFPI
ncbi:hypothetical protein FRB99_008731 [Tulasnella sp. 403]|nr:hypothetical protein FRB99_008731 [Tulasnella sp. 403]